MICQKCKKEVKELFADMCDKCWLEEYSDIGKILLEAADNDPY